MPTEMKELIAEISAMIINGTITPENGAATIEAAAKVLGLK